MVVVSRVLPTIFPGSESPGISGNDARSRSSESSPSEGRTADGAISSAAAAAGGDGDHQAAALGEIVAPEGNPGEGVATADSIDRGGMTAMRQAAAEPAPPQGPCPSGAVESTATCPKGQEGQIQNEEVPRAAAILTGDGVRSAGVVPETAEGFELVQGEEVDKERAGGVTMATVEGSGEEADSQRPVRADSRSTDGAVEASGSRPETASDKDGGATSREGREELNRARSESRLSRKATKRSVSAGSRARTGGKVRTSAGGASGVAEAPANTPHLQVTTMLNVALSVVVDAHGHVYRLLVSHKLRRFLHRGVLGMDTKTGLLPPPWTDFWYWSHVAYIRVLRVVNHRPTEPVRKNPC